MKSALLSVVAAAAGGVNAAAIGIPAKQAPTAACGNLGLQWAYIADDYDFYNASSYPGYDPTVLKQSHLIEEIGVTTYLYYSHSVELDQNDPQAVYPSAPGGSKATLPPRYFALNHRGYLYAEHTGTYVFRTSAVDDILFLWVGQQAYSGWTRGDADDSAQLDTTYYVPGTSVYEAPLVAGNYYPLRIVFKQGDGNAEFSFDIEDPTGQILITGDPGNSELPTNNILQYSCDEITAPKFPPYGEEN